MSEFGYAGDILRVDLSNSGIKKLLSADYSKKFIGGRGFAAKIYWDETTARTRALEPDNCLLIMTGPLGGFLKLAGSRWTVCGNSPEVEPEAFSYSNLGGSWGAWLKYAGFDGIAVIGRADRPVYIYIHDGLVEIRDASQLWGKNAVETLEQIQSEFGRGTRVMTIGQAGENQVTFATIFASDNAVGASGFGAVMGSKMLKAIAVKTDQKKRPVASDPDRLKSLVEQIVQLKSKTRETVFAAAMPPENNLTRLTMCHGCINGCPRQAYRGEDGRKYKFFCQASNVYNAIAQQYGSGIEVSMLATRLCDIYGLDTAVVEPIISWLGECYSAGLLTEEQTGLPLSRIGSADFIETLVRKISFREGFGDILALGTLRAAKIVGKEAQKLTNVGIGIGTGSRASEGRDYDPRLIPTNILFYATEPRRAIQVLHGASVPFLRWSARQKNKRESAFSYEVIRQIAEEFWGSVEAADFSTYAGKALAAKKIQDYNYIKECLVLCDMHWPFYQIRTLDKKLGFSTLESRVFAAVTGREIDEMEFNRFGERIFNLQRAIHVNQGWGGRRGDTLLDYLHDDPLEWTLFAHDCVIPGKNGIPTSRKGTVIERDDFEALKDEYYQLRDWDLETGFQTRAILRDLELGDIAEDLGKRGLAR